jgi:hypothetical protein
MYHSFIFYFYVLVPTCFGSSLPSSTETCRSQHLKIKNKGVVQSVHIVGFSSNTSDMHGMNIKQFMVEAETIFIND